MPPKQSFEQTDKFQRRNQIVNIISLEGNVGCGKSTFLKLINEAIQQIKILQQPVCQWQKIGQKEINLLDYYYKDPTRWGLTFQNFAFLTRIKKWKEYQDSTDTQIKLSERSILADRYIFASIMKDSNYLNQIQHQIYLETYNGFMEILNIKPIAGMIYLRCQPQICSERIKKRNRSEETTIPLQYLELIHKKHEEWLNELDNVLILDTTEEFETNLDRRRSFIEKVKNFIQKVAK